HPRRAQRARRHGGAEQRAPDWLEPDQRAARHPDPGMIAALAIATALNATTLDKLARGDSREEAISALVAAGDAAALPVLRALQGETDARVKEALRGTHAMLALASPDRQKRFAAIEELRKAHAQRQLTQRLALEQDPQILAALRSAIESVEASQRRADMVGLVFSGLSLASILLLAALGLAITFGLMGVINMAHGELLMVGAYATWLVQSAFRGGRFFDWYLAAALPA